MANISQYLAAIMSAVYGRDVRKSIHDAIKEVNTAQEQALNAGTAISDGDPAGGVYEESLYINTDTNDLLRCNGLIWEKIDNIQGRGIVSIVKTNTSGLTDTYTITYTDDSTQTYNIVNGKDGMTWFNGVEITGTATASTGFVLASNDCKAGDMYFNVSDGSVYVCDIGATAGNTSYWTFKFKMSGGGGGAQFLYALQDVQASTVQSPSNGQILKWDASVNKWIASYGGSGHTMKPDPAIATEANVVSNVNGAASNNDEVASLFGIQRWSNVKTIRLMITSGIGHNGIGEWQWVFPTTPTKAQETNTWGWFYHESIKKLGDLTKLGYDYELSFKFDSGNHEVITYGGHQVDTDTGCICIRFANYVIDPSNAKIAVDINIVRNDIAV